MRGRGSGTRARERRLREANRREGTTRSDASGARVAGPHRLPRRPAVRARRRARDGSRGGGRRGGGVGNDSKGGMEAGEGAPRVGEARRERRSRTECGEEPGGGAARTPAAGGGDPPGHPPSGPAPASAEPPASAPPGGPGPAGPPAPEAPRTPRGRPRGPPGSPPTGPDPRATEPRPCTSARRGTRSGPGHRENPKLGLRRPRDAEGPFRDRAAAFPGRSRSSRSRRFSCRDSRSAGGSSRVRPSDRPPSSGAAVRTRFRIAGAVGSNSFDSDSGLRPPRTDSTIRGRNSSGYRRLLRLFIRAPPRRMECPRDRGNSTFPAQAPKTPKVPCFPRSGTSV